jgi:long-chain acyl-CoA synthetase
MQVHDLLLRSAAGAPDAPMLWENGVWWSYSALLSRSRRIAYSLSNELSLATGSHVAVYWDNNVDAIAASFAVWFAGCVLVPINTELRGSDLAYPLDHSEAVAVIAGRRQLRHFLEVCSALSTVQYLIVDGPLPSQSALTAEVISLESILKSGRELIVNRDQEASNLAAIMYTSGSTGIPKGVMLTHVNLLCNTQSIVAYLKLTARDRVMMILPHFYIYGLSLVLTHVFAGGSIVLDNRFMYPNCVLQTMLETEVTGFSGVPSTFSILLSRSKVREMAFPSLRYVTQAGGAMPPAVQLDIASLFSPARLFIMYGATEASPRLSYLNPDDLERKAGSIGKAVPGVELFVADADGNRLPPGQEGELVARGPNITPGYWRDPEATAQILRNGIYRTGDLGVEDNEGFIFVTGRLREIIKSKGFRVSPLEIENHILKFDGVAEVAVIGVSNELFGEAPVAFVVPIDGIQLTIDAIRRFLQARLPSYKQPVRYHVVNALPKGASGKVQKWSLQEPSEILNA